MRLFERLAYLVARRRRAVLLASSVLVLAGAGLAPVFQSQLLGVGYDWPGTESDEATQFISSATGYAERDVLVISSERYTAREAVFEHAVDEGVAAVKRVDEGILVLGPGVAGGGAISRDQRVVIATVGLRGDAADRHNTSKELQKAVDAAMPPGMNAGITGKSPLMADLVDLEKVDMAKAELVGLPVAGVVLLIAFGSAVAAGLPMLLAICGLFVSVGVIAGFMAFMDFNAFAGSLMAMIGLAVGIDYSLLFVRRYREEQAKGGEPADSIARTLATAGRTITFSGAILSTSLIPLVAAGLPAWRDIAIAMIVVVMVEVMLTMTLLPAVLLTLGHRLDNWSVPVRLRNGTSAAGAVDWWHRWAMAVMRRPWRVLAAGVALLVLAASPVLGLQTGIDLNTRAMKGEESGKALAQLEDHFPPGTLAPVEILVRSSRPELAEVTSRARSVLQTDERLSGIRSLRVADGAALLLATPTVGVDTKAAEDMVRDLRVDLGAAVPPGARTMVTGSTAQTVDYTDETNRITPWVIGLALLVAFALLLWLFRSPVLAAKAIVMNLLSIGAAFGLTVLVFQHGFGEDLLGFTSAGYIQSWVPLGLFMMLFGLSMDYEVFMVSRIREEWEKTGDTTAAVAAGLQRTGGVVTSAAAIMVAIFASFLLTSIPEMKQLGFGLAIAVLIDATIVRALLVPAFMCIAGDWNWWMPRRLDRLLPRLEH